MKQSEVNALREAAMKALKSKPVYDPKAGDKLDAGDVLMIIHDNEVNWIEHQAYTVLEQFQADKSSHNIESVRIALSLLRHIQGDEAE